VLKGGTRLDLVFGLLLASSLLAAGCLAVLLWRGRRGKADV
jgi:hypothetical protein